MPLFVVQYWHLSTGSRPRHVLTAPCTRVPATTSWTAHAPGRQHRRTVQIMAFTSWPSRQLRRISLWLDLWNQSITVLIVSMIVSYKTSSYIHSQFRTCPLPICLGISIFVVCHFVMVPFNLTYLHCLQHFMFEHLFNLYYIDIVCLVCWIFRGKSIWLRNSHEYCSTGNHLIIF